MAAHRNDIAMMTLLLGMGAEVNSIGFGGQTPLMECCFNGSVEGVKLMMLAGATVTTVNAQNATSLHLVARGIGHHPNLKSKGVDVAQIEKDRVNIVQLLLKAGVDPSLEDNRCRTALEECIIQEGFDSEMAKVLLRVSPPPQFNKRKKKQPASQKPMSEAENRLSLSKQHLTFPRKKDISDDILIATLKEQTRNMSLSQATTAMISEKALEDKFWKAVDGKMPSLHVCCIFIFSCCVSICFICLVFMMILVLSVHATFFFPFSVFSPLSPNHRSFYYLL
jgi:ankyrin repeat protein